MFPVAFCRYSVTNILFALHSPINICFYLRFCGALLWRVALSSRCCLLGLVCLALSKKVQKSAPQVIITATSTSDDVAFTSEFKRFPSSIFGNGNYKSFLTACYLKC